MPEKISLENRTRTAMHWFAEHFENHRSSDWLLPNLVALATINGMKHVTPAPELGDMVNRLSRLLQLSNYEEYGLRPIYNEDFSIKKKYRTSLALGRDKATVVARVNTDGAPSVFTMEQIKRGIFHTGRRTRLNIRGNEYDVLSRRTLKGEQKITYVHRGNFRV